MLIAFTQLETKLHITDFIRAEIKGIKYVYVGEQMTKKEHDYNIIKLQRVTAIPLHIYLS